MKNKAYQQILNQVPDLNHSQRLGLKNKLTKVDSEKAVCDLLEERIEKNPQCLYCQSRNIIKHGHSAGLTRYRCKSCGKTFNALSGTPLARLRKKELWLDYLQCLLNSFSIRKSAKKVQVNSKTAFKWRHRLLNSSHKLEDELFSGIVEADESYFRKSMKGSKKLDRPPRKRGEPAPQRGLSRAHVCVLFVCDRNGHEADYITGLGPVNSRWLDRFLTPHLTNDTLLFTDKASSFRVFSRHRHLAHQTVTSKKGERVNPTFPAVRHNSLSLNNWTFFRHYISVKTLNI